MNAKKSVFVICVEAIIYLLLYDLHDCTFKCSSYIFTGITCFLAVSLLANIFQKNNQ